MYISYFFFQKIKTVRHPITTDSLTLNIPSHDFNKCYPCSCFLQNKLGPKRDADFKCFMKWLCLHEKNKLLISLKKRERKTFINKWITVLKQQYIEMFLIRKSSKVALYQRKEETKETNIYLGQESSKFELHHIGARGSSPPCPTSSKTREKDAPYTQKWPSYTYYR